MASILRAGGVGPASGGGVQLKLIARDENGLRYLSFQERAVVAESELAIQERPRRPRPVDPLSDPVPEVPEVPEVIEPIGLPADLPARLRVPFPDPR